LDRTAENIELARKRQELFTRLSFLVPYSFVLVLDSAVDPDPTGSLDPGGQK
jgi:hypothetical protein